MFGGARRFGSSLASTSLLIALLFLFAACAPLAERGDRVTIDYVARFSNGTVFDTSIARVAQENGIYSDLRLYAPLIFTIGDGTVIPGLDKGVIGMRKGESRRITVAPEDAYGPEKKGLFATYKVHQSTPRVIPVKREERVPAPVFFSRHLDAEPGDEITSGGTRYTYVRREGNEVVLRIESVVGDHLALPKTSWNGTIIAENETAYLVRQDPPAVDTIETPLGPATLTVTNEAVDLDVIAAVGDSFTQQGRRGRVVAHNGTHIIVDYNHPLAGETLVFDVTLLALEKGSQ